MLDPKETKKGGFGAFADRDRERREQLQALEQRSGESTTVAPVSVPSPAKDTTDASPAAPGSDAPTPGK
jgi:hypothetical protein